VLAINGERILLDTLVDRMIRLRPGMDARILIARRGRILEIPLVMEEARPATFAVKLSPDFGKQHLRHLETWLGQSLKAADE
jgi:predicted metalloprotease with PDZ domain